MKSTLICVLCSNGRRFVCQKKKKKKRRLLFVSDHRKMYFWKREKEERQGDRAMGGEGERGKSKGSMVVAHKERLSERGKIEGGERENGLHSQKPLKFDSPSPHSLNKSTCRSFSPFLSSVWVPPLHPPHSHPAFGTLLTFNTHLAELWIPTSFC